jgi:hypothetical protein
MIKKNKKTTQVEQIQNIEDQLNFDEINASLNFAFCPTFPLKVNEKIKEESGLFNSSKIKDNETLHSLLDIGRNFYICYSFKFEDNDKDYFFFQSFSMVGFEIFHSEPLFGFFTTDQILMLISQIDEMFLPQKHEKQIYDSYLNESITSASYLLAIMGEWTKLKLDDFEYLYLTSAETSEQIQELARQINNAKADPKIKNKRKTKSRSKVKTNTSKVKKNGTEPSPKRKPKRKPTAGSKSAESNKSSKSRAATNKKTNTTKNTGGNSRSNKK